MRAYYDSFGEREWDRLTRPDDGAVEFAVTRRAIEDYLPPGARVLDIGGGPGRYSLWLAERGHRVALADLSPDADRHRPRPRSPRPRRLPWLTKSRWPTPATSRAGLTVAFDAALALGPFYHLPDPADRDRAARELARVLRRGGVAFVALMPRYAFLRRTLAIPDERRHLASPAFVARVLDDGVFENDIPGRFTGGYGVRPEEVAPFFARYGFAARALLAAESIVPDLQEPLAALAVDDPDALSTRRLDVARARGRRPEHPGPGEPSALRRTESMSALTTLRHVRADLSTCVGHRHDPRCDLAVDARARALPSKPYNVS